MAITGALILLAIAPAFAQSKKDPLTDQQIEDVREAGDQPLQRIKLFVGYVDERAKGIHTINADPIAQNKNRASAQLDGRVHPAFRRAAGQHG